MFDILLYLYDNYLVADMHPDAEVLSRKLTAAGFEAEDIDRALDWLSSLERLELDRDWQESDPAGGRAVRIYTAGEARRLDPAGIGFLAHLEGAGLLSPQGREWVIDQAMALEDGEVPGDKIKLITLLAISRLHGPGDALWLEDLVRGGEDGWRPTIH
jgi:Smg protein